MPQSPLLTLLELPVIHNGMRRFLSATEFSRLIERDKKTVIRWVQQGYIPNAKRVGHIYQIPLTEVEIFKNSAAYPPQKWQK